jgi:hypothetical protein
LLKNAASSIHIVNFERDANIREKHSVVTDSSSKASGTFQDEVR